MREVAQLLNEMRAEGAITEYALFGAVAQMRYTEPVATLDADVLVVLPSAEGLEGESVRVGAWPVQFVPVFSPLTQEALEQADTAEFEGVPFRVVRADYLAVIALSVGRAKDLTRILALLEAEGVTPAGIAMLAQRHGLSDAWSRFKTRFLDD